jgi:hypothetical protein
MFYMDKMFFECKSGLITCRDPEINQNPLNTMGAVRTVSIDAGNRTDLPHRFIYLYERNMEIRAVRYDGDAEGIKEIKATEKCVAAVTVRKWMRRKRT